MLKLPVFWFQLEVGHREKMFQVYQVTTPLHFCLLVNTVQKFINKPQQLTKAGMV